MWNMRLFCFVFEMWVSVSSGWPPMYYIAEDDLELLILSLASPKEMDF